MAFLLRAIRRNLGLYTSMTVGGAAGYTVGSKNIADIREVVTKDVMEISEDHGRPYVHIERKMIFLSMLPLRAVSRAFGHLANVEFPGFILQPLLGLYARTYGVNLDEAVDPDLSHYKTLGSFFNRDIKPSCRQMDKTAELVSPCDGRILALGRVSAVQARQGHFSVEQVKGVTFSLTSFLGSPFGTFPSSKQKKAEMDLFYCTIYLAPGDFHGFVAPTEWKVHERRHFSGRLFSVKPTIAEIVRPLFTLNERVLYTGLWRHGFFSFTAVAATNVGNIEIDFDKELKTNTSNRVKPFLGKLFHHQPPPSESQPDDQLDVPVNVGDHVFKRGDMFGRFRLGSTIVLIFEAPKSTEFSVEPGQRVLIGQPLANIANKIPAT